MKKILLFIIIFASLHANITLEDIYTKPKSNARDFYIWQYLKQKTTSTKDAKKVYKLVKNKSNRYIKKAYENKIKPKLSLKQKCKRYKNLLKIKNDKCLNYAFSPYKTRNLTKKQRNQLLHRNIDKNKKEILKLQNLPYSIKYYKQFNTLKS